MITFLNKKQLAFILDIKPEDARAKMCVAWCKYKGIQNKATMIGKKIFDEYPDSMSVEMLAVQLNLPTLQDMVNDITDNYLKRPASKKWILCDYPAKQILKLQEAGKGWHNVKIPTGLRSLLPDAVVVEIKKEWSNRFGI